MPPSNLGLSERATKVLEMIAAGSTYDQFLSAFPDLTYLDIFDAAREALDLSVAAAEDSTPKPAYSVAEIRTRCPRACERWSEADDALLGKLARSGTSVARIANRLQRQRSAIRSRILKLDLIEVLSPHEQAELRRISTLDPKDAADAG
jgi:hypothetical protein